MKKLLTAILIVVSTVVLTTSLTGCGVNRSDTSVKLTAAKT